MSPQVYVMFHLILSFYCLVISKSLAFSILVFPNLLNVYAILSVFSLSYFALPKFTQQTWELV